LSSFLIKFYVHYSTTKFFMQFSSTREEGGVLDASFNCSPHISQGCGVVCMRLADAFDTSELRLGLTLTSECLQPGMYISTD